MNVDIAIALAFLYLGWGELVQDSMDGKRDEKDVRCWVVLSKKLPEANAPEPRRHTPSSLRCRVDLDPNNIHENEWPQGWVRAVCDHRRRRRGSVVGQPTEKRTHRRKRVKKMQMGIMLVHSATEIVCRRRTRGMLAGTKLEGWREIRI
jgi:hypothetical protein